MAAMLSQDHDKTITLVLGGVRSGKSRYAQQLASACGSVTFIATALPSDAEMRRKIAAHRRDRPRNWRTVEAPVQLEDAIRDAAPNSKAIVIDCLTTYLANQMSNRNGKHRIAKKPEAVYDAEKLCNALRSAEASIIVVSNEVGSGVVPAFRSGRIYRDLLGSLNQRIAAISDRVVLMVAGLPMTIKGQEAKSC